MFRKFLQVALLCCLLWATNAKADNDSNLICIEAQGAVFFSTWTAALLLAPPFDAPPSFASFGLNLGLKQCPPYLSVPAHRDIDPGEACEVSLAAPLGETQTQSFIFWVPTSSTTRWGGLGNVTATHMNSDVEVELRRHSGLAKGNAIEFPIGKHRIDWRGHTQLSTLDFVHVYIPSIPSGARWKAAKDVFKDVILEAGLITADQFIDGGRHGVHQDVKQTLNVLDLKPPEISFSQSQITVEANAFGGATRYFYQPQIDALMQVSDACDRPVSLSYNRNFFPVNELTPLVVTATDPGPNASGLPNAAQAELWIEVVDTVPPVIQPPENIVMESAGAAEILLQRPDVFDFVDAAPTVCHDVPDVPVEAACSTGLVEFPQGVTQVTWTATDASGNESMVGQTVNIKAVGTNQQPVAYPESANALTEQVVEIFLEASDPDLDPLNFEISRSPDHGSLISPLLPFFIEDYRAPVGVAPEGESYRCQPGRPADQLAWPHAMSVTQDGFTYILDVASELPGGDCETVDFPLWPEFRLHKLAPDGSWVNSVDLPPVGGFYFGSTLSINEKRGVLVHAVDDFPDFGGFLLVDLDTLEIIEEIEFDSNEYQFPWKGLLTDDDVLIWTSGVPQIHFHDLSERREVTADNELHVIDPWGDSEFTTDIVLDSEGHLYVQPGWGPVFKYEPYAIEPDGQFTPGALIGWLGACDSGSGCDVANQRSRGFSCTQASCPTYTHPGYTETSPGRLHGYALALDPLDNLYVGGYSIQRFTSSGLYSGIAYPDCPTEERCFVLGDFGGAVSLFVNDHHLYTVDSDFELVHVFQTSVITPIDEDTASVKYLSSWGFEGTDTFEFTASDGLATSAAAEVSVNVTRQFRAPVAYSDRRQEVTEDTPTVLLLDGYDPDGPIDTLSFEVVETPLYGSISELDGTYTYIPEQDFNGEDQVQFRVYDGLEYSAPEVFYIDVMPVNDAPVIDWDPATEGGMGYTVRLSADFSDADEGDHHTVSVDWGDGSVESEGEVLSNGSMTGPVLNGHTGSDGSVFMAHEYGSADTYTITLCLTDNVVEIGEVKTPTETSLQSCFQHFIDISEKADLSPKLSLLDPTALADTISYTVTVDYLLPEIDSVFAATDVTLDHAIENATILSISELTEGPSNCSWLDHSIHCEIPSLLPGDDYNVMVTIAPDGGVGEQLLAQVAVGSDTPDPYPENSLSRVINLVAPADYIVNERRDLIDDLWDGQCSVYPFGTCSLRGAIEEAFSEADDNTPKVIQLGEGRYVMDYEGDGGKTGLGVFSDVIIRGLSPEKTVLVGDDTLNHNIWAWGTSMVLENLSLVGAEGYGALEARNADVELRNVSISHNRGDFSTIRLINSDVLMENLSIHGNRPDSVALIQNDHGNLTLRNVSISDNEATGSFIYQYGEGTATLHMEHVTISQNTTPELIVNDDGGLTVANSVISGNETDVTILCIAGSASSLGGNVLGGALNCLSPGPDDTVSDDPDLKTAEYVAPGHYVMLPDEGSAVLKHGLPENCLVTDLLGRSRMSPCDAGAIELFIDKIFSSGFE